MPTNPGGEGREVVIEIRPFPAWRCAARGCELPPTHNVVKETKYATGGILTYIGETKCAYHARLELKRTLREPSHAH